MIPYEFIPAMGQDIILRYQIKPIKHEHVLYIEEIHLDKKNNKIVIFLLTDLRIIYAMVNLGAPPNQIK
jgi:hypothetical protein